MTRVLIKLVPAVLLLASLELPLLAAERHLDIERFNSLDIGINIQGSVACGIQNRISLRGKKSEIDNIEVTIDGGNLELSRGSTVSAIFKEIFSDEKVEKIHAEIVIDGQLSHLVASTGSTLKIHECAINNSYLVVDAGTGAKINVNGRTSKLELDLSAGSIFNYGTKGFTVDLAKVDLSTGVEANLCGATIIEGNATTGAIIVVSKSVQLDDLSSTLGAKIRRRNCKLRRRDK